MNSNKNIYLKKKKKKYFYNLIIYHYTLNIILKY